MQYNLKDSPKHPPVANWVFNFKVRSSSGNVKQKNRYTSVTSEVMRKAPGDGRQYIYLAENI